MNNSYFVILSVILLIYIIVEVGRKNYSIKESIWWVTIAFIMLVLSAFPKLIDKVALSIGITYPPSLLFTLCIVFLIMNNFKNEKKISEQKNQITDLAQYYAILKEKVDIIEENINEGNRKTKKH